MVAWGVMGGGEEQERGITKGHMETWKDDGCVHSLDCGDGFTGVYKRQNLSHFK